MKLHCNVLIQNSGSIDHRRSCKGIISIAKSKSKSTNKFELHVSTPKDIRGRLFELSKETVHLIQSRFVNNGRATIQFSNPAIDVFISEAIPENLKKFLTALKSLLNGKETGVDVLQTVKNSDFTSFQKFLTISDKNYYPRGSHTFPSTLQVLRVTGLRLHAVDGRWFGLNGLQHLDLSQNLLGKVPNFGVKFLNVVRLRNLRTLSLAHNDIAEISAELWDSFPVSLIDLDLSFNNISFLSPMVSRLVNLHRLNISNNRLRLLPDKICCLRSLRLLDVSCNQLSFVPGSLSRMKFDSVDFSDNADLFSFPVGAKSSSSSVAYLIEIGAAAVERNKLSIHHLPWDLRYSLSEYTAICSTCLNIFPRSSICSYLQYHGSKKVRPTLVARGREGEMNVVRTSDEISLLKEKISEANVLLTQIGERFENVDGAQKLCNKVKAEIKFLTNGAKLEVDLVLNDGEIWVKVISRNARGLAMDYVASGGGSNRSIIDQARCFKSMAANYPYFYTSPGVIFQFLNGVPDLIAEELVSYGIRVVGEMIPIGGLVTLPEDSESDSLSSDTCSSKTSHFEEEEEEKQGSFCKEGSQVLNLDITAVFALISALTHGNGANFRFASSMLNDQATLERKRPVLPGLLKFMEGKQLIMCRTAYKAVQDILSTVAGPEEKKRADELFRKVDVVEDKISERAEALKMSDKINKRSKVIFGSGDYYRAITLTANRHFVNAAAYQGLRFAVILHESRALSEQKQMLAEPL